MNIMLISHWSEKYFESVSFRSENIGFFWVPKYDWRVNSAIGFLLGNLMMT